MKKTPQSPANYAFIDSQNLNLGVKSQGWKLDWRKFRQYLRNKYHDDGDFHCLIEYLGKNDKLHRILAPNKNYSSLLRSYNSYVVRIDLLKKSLQLSPATKKTKISGRSKP